MGIRCNGGLILQFLSQEVVSSSLCKDRTCYWLYTRIILQLGGLNEFLLFCFCLYLMDTWPAGTRCYYRSFLFPLILLPYFRPCYRQISDHTSSNCVEASANVMSSILQSSAFVCNSLLLTTRKALSLCYRTRIVLNISRAQWSL
jgi:hypothetical protein